MAWINNKYLSDGFGAWEHSSEPFYIVVTNYGKNWKSIACSNDGDCRMITASLSKKELIRKTKSWMRDHDPDGIREFIDGGKYAE